MMNVELAEWGRDSREEPACAGHADRRDERQLFQEPAKVDGQIRE
jgi:hypothetical protein